MASFLVSKAVLGDASLTVLSSKRIGTLWKQSGPTSSTYNMSLLFLLDHFRFKTEEGPCMTLLIHLGPKWPCKYLGPKKEAGPSC